MSDHMQERVEAFREKLFQLGSVHISATHVRQALRASDAVKDKARTEERARLEARLLSVEAIDAVRDQASMMSYAGPDTEPLEPEEWAEHIVKAALRGAALKESQEEESHA